MTYCEVGLTRSVGLIIGGSPIRVGQKSGKEGRKEKKEGGAFSMAQIANFSRSIDRRRRHATPRKDFPRSDCAHSDQG